MSIPTICKTCTKCGEEKPLTEFWRNASGRLGYSSWCKDCMREYRGTKKRMSLSEQIIAEMIDGILRDNGYQHEGNLGTKADIVIRKGNLYRIFEVKSFLDDRNIDTGVGQILRYLWEAKRATKIPVRGYLIIYTTRRAQLQFYVQKLEDYNLPIKIIAFDGTDSFLADLN